MEDQETKQNQAKEPPVKETEPQGELRQAEEIQIKEIQVEEPQGKVNETQAEEIQIKEIQVEETQGKVNETQAEEIQIKEIQIKEIQIKEPLFREIQVKEIRVKNKSKGNEAPIKTNESQGNEAPIKTNESQANATPVKTNESQANEFQANATPVKTNETQDNATPVKTNESQANATPVKTNETQANATPVKTNETQANATPVKTNESQANEAPIKTNESQGNEAPIKTNESQGNEAPIKTNESQANATPIKTNESQANATPVKTNETQANATPVKTNESQANATPVKTKESQANATPVKTNDSQANETPVKTNETQANEAPIKTNESQANATQGNTNESPVNETKEKATQVKQPPRPKQSLGRKIKKIPETLRQQRAKLEGLERMVHIQVRRLFSKTQHMSAGYHTTGPITFVITSTAIGVAAVLNTLYTTSYAVTVNGESMGVVLVQEDITQVVEGIEAQGKSLLGEDYALEQEVQFEFGLYLKSDITNTSALEHHLYSQLDALGAELARYAVVLQGKQIAVLEEEATLQEVLDRILESHTTENTISVEFVENITTQTVYDGEFISWEDLEALLTENTTGETSYTVVSGDTFNGIAYKNDMSVSELASLNPQMDPDRLYVGDEVNVKETIPLLSVMTTEHIQYTETIPCPVEEVSDASSYVGTTKITQQGVEGEAEISAHVSYLNGREMEREILETVVIREATKTIKAVGTAERPKTASYGKYIWPTSGRISSYFGGRQVYGVYNYHNGIDIAAPYGTPVYAADGGTVTFSGWRSSYGNLVIITHDNGAQTYYAHNSSLLVSSGQKVSRGQQIAKVGSTGNSTGNHLHFEIRIGGQPVNPLGYLS